MDGVVDNTCLLAWNEPAGNDAEKPAKDGLLVGWDNR